MEDMTVTVKPSDIRVLFVLWALLAALVMYWHWEDHYGKQRPYWNGRELACPADMLMWIDEQALKDGEIEVLWCVHRENVTQAGIEAQEQERHARDLHRE
jgi:hypothetical protein